MKKPEPPPPQRRRGHDWEAIVAEAKAHPGQWRKVLAAAGYGYAANVNAGRIRAVRLAREDGWEISAVQRDMDQTTRTTDVWLQATRKEGP